MRVAAHGGCDIRTSALPARAYCEGMNKLRTSFAAALLCTALGSAQAQFKTAPPAAANLASPPSNAVDDKMYRKDGARHLYKAYGRHVWKGKLKPNLYGVAVVRTTIDASGTVQSVDIVRPPAAPEVGPWITSMIRKASPFPAPAAAGTVSYTEVWLVDKSGRFQLDTLTEGQL
jgi:periplasmic protein TonB